MSVKERLTKYLEYKEISKSEFGRTIGVSSGFVTSLSKSIQPDKLERISLKYSDLNLTWLLTGIGKMIVQETKSISSSQPHAHDPMLEIIRTQGETIKLQMESMAAKDRQIDELLSMLKKTNVRAEDDVECVDVKKSNLAI